MWKSFGFQHSFPNPIEKGGKNYSSKSSGKNLTGLKIKLEWGILRRRDINGRENKSERENEDTLGS